jgi:hypothetical protein
MGRGGGVGCQQAPGATPVVPASAPIYLSTSLQLTNHLFNYSCAGQTMANAEIVKNKTTSALTTCCTCISPAEVGKKLAAERVFRGRWIIKESGWRCELLEVISQAGECVYTLITDASSRSGTIPRFHRGVYCTWHYRDASQFLPGLGLLRIRISADAIRIRGFVRQN